MAKYRRTQNLVDAVQWTGDNLKEVYLFLINQGVISKHWKPEIGHKENMEAYILDSVLGHVYTNEWIVVERSHRLATTVYKDEIFQNLFEFVLSDED